MSDSKPGNVHVEDLDAPELVRNIREMDVGSRGDALRFVMDLVKYIDGQKTASKAFGYYEFRLNYRGKGLDSVDITDHHSIKFKPKGE